MAEVWSNHFDISKTLAKALLFYKEFFNSLKQISFPLYMFGVGVEILHKKKTRNKLGLSCAKLSLSLG